MPWGGKRVVVIGHGPFAIEQTRTALEHQSMHVMILCRRHGLVCPQILDYLNIVRPFTETFSHMVDGSGLMLQLWQSAYALARATPPESWKQGIFRPDGHSVSVSDVYFIGHALGLVSTQRTTTRCFHSNGVSSQDGTFHEAQIVIKAVGFEINEGNECLLGRSHMSANTLVDRGLWAMFEPHLDATANLLPLVGHVSAMNFAARTVVSYWKDPTFVNTMATERLSRVRINHVTASESNEALFQAAEVNPAVHTELMEHVQGVANACGSTWSPKEYLDHNKRQWGSLHDVLLPLTDGSRSRLSYPFDRALQVLQDEASHLVGALEGAATVCEAPMLGQQSTVTNPFIQTVLSMPRSEQRVYAELAVLRIVRELTGAPTASLNAETPLMEAGIDSLAATELSSRLQALAGSVLSPTLVFEQPSSRAVAAHLLAVAMPAIPSRNEEHASILPAFEKYGGDTSSGREIIVQGTSARWAGNDAGSAVCMLWACGDAVGAVPSARWNLDAELDVSELTAAQLRGVAHGSFVTGAHLFDNSFFSVSLIESQVMDPQQRLLLESGYTALHQSLLRRTQLRGSMVSIAIGMELPDWHAVKALFPASMRYSFAIGDPVSVASGRLSFALGLHGPCKTIDTACSSGICAVHDATVAVGPTEDTSALAAAVSLKLRPHTTLGLLVSGTVSSDGRCKTFDMRANGYARAEAIGAIALRQMAPQQGHIHVACLVVRHDGRSASLTAPNGSAQRMLLDDAWSQCMMPHHPNHSLEAHGTGTALGDPTEIGALAAAWRRSEHGLTASSHKGNTGHAEAPSGVSLPHCSRLTNSSPLHRSRCHLTASPLCICGR